MAANIPAVVYARDGMSVTVDGQVLYRPGVALPMSFAPGGASYCATPSETLQPMLDAMAPGDVLYLAPGVYEQAIVLPSGRPQRATVLSALPGCMGLPVLCPPDAWFLANPRQAVVTCAGEHAILNGIGIVGGNGRPGVVSDKYGANGITFQTGGGHGCYVTNCWITAAAHCGIKELHHGGTGIRAAQNLIWNCGQTMNDHGIYCPAHACTFSENLLWGNAGAGLHIYDGDDGPAGVKALSNVIWNNKVWGILLAGRKGIVRQNTVALNPTGIMYFRGTCVGNQVDHNIVAFNDTNGGWDNAGQSGLNNAPAGNSDGLNCYYRDPPDKRLGSQIGGGQVYADPHFRDVYGYDFRLATGSLAQGKGAF